VGLLADWIHQHFLISSAQARTEFQSQRAKLLYLQGALTYLLEGPSSAAQELLEAAVQYNADV
jgi:Tfp pilus assembly protein PilF